ncbi:MAG: alpha-amylase family glycosyl hydrolase [Planctomycetota bacterium]
MKPTSATRRHPLLLEVPARTWLSELSERAGRKVTLGDVPEEDLDALADLGFDAVWLMGAWTTGPDAAAIARLEPALQPSYFRSLPDYRPSDCAGSPFSIAAYEAPPELGGAEGLAAFRGALRRRGVRLVLDFVPNHLGRDHPWVDEEPEIFVGGSAEDVVREPWAFFPNRDGRVIAHGRDPHFAPWTDSAQLNCALPRARERLLEILLSVSERCDGVRCDMAMLVLPEVLEKTWGARLGPDADRTSFWRDAIAAVKTRRPGFLFIAEVYWGLEARLQEEGFDYTYDKGLYDLLARGDFEGARRHLGADAAFQARCVRFVENHDEERAAAAFGREGSRSAAAVALSAPGLRFFHYGQIEGRRVKLPAQLRRAPREEPDSETARFYRVFLDLLRDPCLQGDFEALEPRPAGPGDPSWRAVFAHLWTPPRRADGAPLAALVVANRSSGTAYARVPLPLRLVAPDRRYAFEDRLGGDRCERGGEELLDPGLLVALAPQQVHLFTAREA